MKIREKLCCLPILDKPGIQEIQAGLVPDEEESVFPIGIGDGVRSVQKQDSQKKYNTNNESFYRLADLMRSRPETICTFLNKERIIMIAYCNALVDGNKIFYREAGSKNAPAILLLHGFPTSSHMFRNLIPVLAEKYHVIAPDLPGFGFSDAPGGKRYRYTFENLAKVIDKFTQTIGLQRYAMYVFDYGAPVGFRLALAHPERITAIISQNGNAYEEGLSEGWNPIQKYWKESTSANREALREFLTPEATKSQYLYGVSDETLVAPEAYVLDSALLARKGNDDIQLDLFLDYASNVALYPKFQEYFRSQQPAFLAVWGKNDPFFLPPGAEAFKRDIPGAEVHFFDTGHFALETHNREIGSAILEFLDRNLGARASAA